jgi:hypothetical protein
MIETRKAESTDISRICAGLLLQPSGFAPSNPVSKMTKIKTL